MTSARPVVLLVEDEALIADLIEVSLEEWGFKVVTTLSATDALKELEVHRARFCGVITDIGVPGGPDGWDVGRRARELRPGIPLIYMSGDSEAEWASKGMPHSVLVLKPFAPMQIATAMSVLLNQTDT